MTSEQSSISTRRIWLRFVRLQQRVSAVMTARLRRIGLSVPQFDLLSTLSEAQGITQNELATRLYVTKGNVSGLVDRLVEAGYVERRSMPGDRRSNALFLTLQGQRMVERGIALQDAFVEETLGALSTDDLAAFDRILGDWRAAVRNLTAADADAA
jgi:DNA-binding MarR family transcriptional regulator